MHPFKMDGKDANTVGKAMTSVNPSDTNPESSDQKRSKSANPSGQLGEKPPVSILKEHEIDIRVRYQETDAQGRVHHANYANYFEIGRIEMLRASGVNYGELEKAGIMLVVVKLECNFHMGAKYDDVLRLKTSLVKAKGVRVSHRYELHMGDVLVAEGQTTVAAISPEGKVVRLPSWLQLN